MKSTSVLIAGDIFPTRQKDLFASGQTEKLFSQEIISLFQQAGLAVCNLEGVLTNASAKRPKCGPALKAAPETVNAIKKLGIGLITLANNHITDYGARGVENTIACLEKEGIACFGAGLNVRGIQPFVKRQVGNRMIGFYGVAETVFNIPDENREGANLYDEYRVCNELKQFRKECDLLIVLYHGGVEYYRYPTPWLKTRFHRMADCGADIIIAQHSHCIGTRENYNGSYLLYGQGNFHFDYGSRPEITGTGLLLELILKEDHSFEIKHHRIHLENGMAVYDNPQDLSAFEERNCRLENGESFDKEFSAYCAEWTGKWLAEFRGNRFYEKVIRKVLPVPHFLRFLRRKYDDHTILRMLEHVRGEEDVEVLQRGLLDFYLKKHMLKKE